MNLAHKPTKVAIVGSSGTGKSTFFTQYIRKANYQKIFVFDSEGEYGLRTGVNVCYSTDDLNKALSQDQQIVFDPCVMFEGDTQTGFEFFAEWTFTLAKQPSLTTVRKLFAVDEAQTLISTDLVSHWLSCVVETGRRYTLDWLSVQQGLHLVHNRIRLQMTDVVAFRTIEKRALDWLEQNEFPVDEVRSLPDFHYVAKNMRTGKFETGEISFDAPSARD